MQKRIKLRRMMFHLFIALVIILIATTFWYGALLVRHYATVIGNREDIVALFNQSDYTRVLQLAEGSLRTNPVNVEARTFAGFASFFLGLYSNESEDRARHLRAAIYHLRLALALDNSFRYRAQTHFILAQTYHTMDEHFSNLVTKHLLAARGLGLDNRELNEHLGLAYIRQGSYEEGIHYLLLANAGESNALFHLALADAYSMVGRLQDAETHYQRAMFLAHDDNLRDRIYMGFARLYYHMGRFNESRELYLELLSRYPNDSMVRFFLGNIYAEEGNMVQARVHWQQALRLDPQNREAYLRLYGQ